MNLPAAPRVLVGTDGKPCFGRYRGVTGTYGWDTLAAPFQRSALVRRLRHKRWHFVSLATDQLFCGLAVVDVGWGTSAFAYAFDRGRREIVASFSPIGLPGVVEAEVGSHACAPCRFHMRGTHIDLEPRGQGGYLLKLASGSFRIEAEYHGKSPRLLAVGAVGGGSVHATQKSTALSLRGWAEAGGRRYVLDGGVASFDYSNGMPGRSSDWRWVSAHTRGFGINLQEGLYGATENALWIDGAIVPVGEARFEVEGTGGLSPWRVRTEDKLVDLRFTPEGVRRDDKQLLFASSSMTQQVGTFDGWVRAAPHVAPRKIERLTGLTEDYRARW